MFFLKITRESERSFILYEEDSSSTQGVPGRWSSTPVPSQLEASEADRPGDLELVQKYHVQSSRAPFGEASWEGTVCISADLPVKVQTLSS